MMQFGAFGTGMPPEMVVACVGIMFGTTTTVILLLPLIKAYVRRLESRSDSLPAAQVSERLARIERSIDAVAVEVERISEHQRFLARLEKERLTGGTREPTH